MRTAPDYIQLYPTLRCDRSCEFCFNRSMPFVPDMSPVAFRAMLDALARTSSKTLDIMGGEPTMHPDIVAFIREAVECGFAVNISTNGSDLNVLAEITRIGGAVTVGVSINDRDTLERIRGFIEMQKPVVKSVFHPGLDRDMINEILSLEPKKFYLIYRDAVDREDLAGTIAFSRFVHAAQSFGPPGLGMVYCSGFVPDIKNYPELSRVRCPAGTTKLGIMPDGSAYPCNLFFGKEEFLLGNILTDPFEAIWQSSALAFFRAFRGNVCPQRTCAVHRQCHGGCPAQALVLSGDIAAPDPRCSALH
ncbi:MAG TPA: radical SAM protein [Nitrospirota bacterium]